MAVTDAAIKNLVLDTPTGYDFTQVKALAGIFRTEYLDPLSEDLSSDLRDQIELLIACHFTVMSVEKGGLVRQSMGDAANTYHDVHPKNVGLYSTRFGAQAVALDSTGTLSSLSTMSPKAELQVY